jgi:hypothetical protein
MEISRNYPTQQVRPRVFPKLGDQIGLKGEEKRPASSGERLLTLGIRVINIILRLLPSEFHTLALSTDLSPSEKFDLHLRT